MGSKDAKGGRANAVFKRYWNGVATSRDPWAYNSSKGTLSKNMQQHIDYCMSQDPDNPIMVSKQVKWSPGLSDRLKKTQIQNSLNPIYVLHFTDHFSNNTYILIKYLHIDQQ